LAKAHHQEKQVFSRRVRMAVDYTGSMLCPAKDARGRAPVKTG